MDFSMTRILEIMRLRGQDALACFNRLEEEFGEGRSLENTGITFSRPQQGLHAFRAQFGQGARYGLSISFPSDIPRDSGVYCETALCHEGGDLAYIDAWGYTDVARFSSFEELIEEIIRIRGLIMEEARRAIT